MRYSLFIALIFAAGLTFFSARNVQAERPILPGVDDVKDPTKEKKGIGVKDGVPTEILSARNVAKTKKRFTIVIYRKAVTVIDVEKTVGSRDYDMVGFTNSYSVQNKTQDEISALMDTIHLKLLSTKVYFRFGKIEKIQEYKYCKQPNGPMVILIGPTGEDVYITYFYKDSLDFYQQVTLAMFNWCQKQYIEGKLENAYNGILGLDAVGDAYLEKDKLKDLKASIVKDYEAKFGKQDGKRNLDDISKDDKDNNVEDSGDADGGKKNQTDDGKAASSKNPDDPKWAKAKSKLSMAVQLEQNDNKEMALKYYKEIVEQYPDSPQAESAKACIDRLSK
jgi:hypothetical protein